jgi:hypothetical protein
MFMNPTGAAIVTGNVITGGGSNGTFNAQSTFPVQNAAISVTNGTASINGNQIANVWQGFVVGNLSAAVASNNVMTHVQTAFGGFGTVGNGAFARNDVTDYSTEIFNTPAFTALNLRCNWWGSASGPVNSAGLSPATFTPFASTPIANQPGVSCTP